VPAHVPAVHTSLVVQAVPSLQLVLLGKFGCVQVSLVPAHNALWHWLPSLAQAVTADWNVQEVVQQELMVPLLAPSSHCSPLSTDPLPQTE
jgi:hypothetical protein